MPKKKSTSGAKEAVAKLKPTSRKAPGKTRAAVRGKTVSSKKAGGEKPRAVKSASPIPTTSEIRSPERSTLDPRTFAKESRRPGRGMGEGSAGQSGDLQGLSRIEDVDSESVEELVEEGQSYEAGIVSGVEDALDPDQGEVRTRETAADDLPGEDTDED